MHLPAYEDLGQLVQDEPARYRTVEPSNGSNVIPKRARPGLAGLGPHRQGGVLVGSDESHWAEPGVRFRV